MGTKLKFSTIFHPQTNGQTEKMNGILNHYLHNYIANNHKDWGDHLGLAKFCYNSAKHLAIKMSPFELVLGIEAKQPMGLTIFRTRGTCHKGDKETKEMAKEQERRKTWAIKLLEKA